MVINKIYENKVGPKKGNTNVCGPPWYTTFHDWSWKVETLENYFAIMHCSTYCFQLEKHYSISKVKRVNTYLDLKY